MVPWNFPTGKRMKWFTYSMAIKSAHSVHHKHFKIISLFISYTMPKLCQRLRYTSNRSELVVQKCARLYAHHIIELDSFDADYCYCFLRAARTFSRAWTNDDDDYYLQRIAMRQLFFSHVHSFDVEHEIMMIVDSYFQRIQFTNTVQLLFPLFSPSYILFVVSSLVFFCFSTIRGFSKSDST